MLNPAKPLVPLHPLGGSTLRMRMMMTNVAIMKKSDKSGSFTAFVSQSVEIEPIWISRYLSVSLCSGEQ